MSDQVEEVKITWTGRIRNRAEKNLPYDRLMPDTQPAYVVSWIYVAGVLTIAALAGIIGSGVILTFKGPTWWHTSASGHFVNSLHFWSVQLFFIFMVVHLWGNFWMAAWRGGRWKTWISGLVAFAVSIGAGLSGYAIQTNVDSQWIAFQAKDGVNATGVGAMFDIANFGQMMMFHIFLFPGIISLVVLAHVVWVRIKGVVPPIDAAKVEAAIAEHAASTQAGA
jgi:ubiquinol-cytochrome c reductase cytochrome b subunit